MPLPGSGYHEDVEVVGEPNKPEFGLGLGTSLGYINSGFTRPGSPSEFGLGDINIIDETQISDKSVWQRVKDWWNNKVVPFLEKVWEIIKKLKITAIPGGWEADLFGAKVRFVKKPNEIPEVTVGNSGNLFPLLMLGAAAFILFFALKGF